MDKITTIKDEPTFHVCPLCGAEWITWKIALSAGHNEFECLRRRVERLEERMKEDQSK